MTREEAEILLDKIAKREYIPTYEEAMTALRATEKKVVEKPWCVVYTAKDSAGPLPAEVFGPFSSGDEAEKWTEERQGKDGWLGYFLITDLCDPNLERKV